MSYLNLRPDTPEQLAEALAEAARARRTIALCGASSKDWLGGPVADADIRISTSALTRVLCYEPRDLTISIEAGLAYNELRRLLAENQQMIPLDPPCASTATVGGVLATNSSGPRRRLYGTARDLVIGLRFATLDGKLPQSGGMVVKNVAGLDMAKLLIGSFGTLAAIAVVNLKVSPMPSCSRTFLRAFTSAGEAFTVRNAILHGVLQPAAIDILNPAASAVTGHEGWLLAVQAQGNRAVVERYSREMPEAQILEAEAEESFWLSVREFTPRFLAANSGGVVTRLNATLTEMETLMPSIVAPSVGRAGNGIVYAHFSSSGGAIDALRGRRGVIASAPPGVVEQWLETGDDFAIMRKIKNMFDPNGLLNRGRLYGRI